jgi:8-oxo-dGTP pyrophosphatase MutT (NUDIX family)
MRKEIRRDIQAIKPFDQLEMDTIESVVKWIDSDEELCRLQKPDIPNKHLVSYFAVVDGDYLLLVDHINAELWLPTGGHVEPGEHPKQTAIRECLEELNIDGKFLIDEPVLITSTETVGKTSGHTDVSIWYALKGNRNAQIDYDESEFYGIKWFHKDSLPEATDPHLGRFVEKLYSTITEQIEAPACSGS